MEREYPGLIRRINSDKNDLLVLAGKYGFSRIVQYLIPDCDMKFLRLAFVESTRFGHLESIQVLLRSGIRFIENPGFNVVINPRRQLKEVIFNGYLEVAKYMIEEAHIFTDELILFVRRLDMLKYILKFETPTVKYFLHRVRAKENLEVVRYLLNYYQWSQADLNTALSKSISFYNTRLAQLLIQKGAQVTSELLGKTSDPEMLDLLNDHITE